ncbi:MAG TPA: hypothetical protein ENI11_05620 [Actinobacteria bacterium]|nr:hypothetical protein [Actinomycetota bacterium]
MTPNTNFPRGNHWYAPDDTRLTASLRKLEHVNITSILPTCTKVHSNSLIDTLCAADINIGGHPQKTDLNAETDEILGAIDIG